MSKIIDISDPSIKVGDYFCSSQWVMRVINAEGEHVTFSLLNSTYNNTLSLSKNRTYKLASITEQEVLLLLLKLPAA